MYSDNESTEILIINESPAFHSFERKDLLKYVIDNYGPLQGYYLSGGKSYNDEILKDYMSLWEYTDLHAGILEPITGLKDKNGEEFYFIILTSLFYSYELKDGFYGKSLYKDLIKYCSKNNIDYNFDKE